MEVSLDSHDPEPGAMRNEIAPELTGAKVGDPGVCTASDTRLFVEAVLIGSREPCRAGVICRASSANGTASTRASGAGHRKASGSGFSRPCRRSRLRIRPHRRILHPVHQHGTGGEKGDSKSGHRQVARRPDHEDCGARRCAWQHLVRFVLLPGQRHDITSFDVLMAGIACLALIGDKAFDRRLAARALDQRRHRARSFRCESGTTGHPAHDAEKYK